MTTDDASPTGELPDDLMHGDDSFDDAVPDTPVGEAIERPVDEVSDDVSHDVDASDVSEPDSSVCHRCGVPVVPGEPFCSNCGFAFGLVDGRATAARPGKGMSGGFLVMLPVLLGVVAVGVLLAFYFIQRDDQPAVTTTVATATTVGSGDVTLPTGDSYGEYVEVSDESGRLTLSVPAAWSDVSGSAWTVDGVDLGPGVAASIDRQAWSSSWGVPGIFIGIDEVRGLSVGEILDAANFEGECTLDSREPYDDGVYTGEMEFYSECGGTTDRFVQIAASPDDGRFVGFLQVVIVTDADVEALSGIIQSWTAA